MDRIDHYRQIIKQILNEYAEIKPAYGEIDMHTVFDDQQGRYQLMAIGWKNRRRVHGCVIHIDIVGDKVWLQHDSTDVRIAQQLIDLGIPQEDIVLGFQLPQHRKLQKKFAVGF